MNEEQLKVRVAELEAANEMLRRFRHRKVEWVELRQVVGLKHEADYVTITTGTSPGYMTAEKYLVGEQSKIRYVLCLNGIPIEHPHDSGVCCYCGSDAEGNYAINRDGDDEGPLLPLCDEHGRRERPTMEEIWGRIRIMTGA